MEFDFQSKIQHNTNTKNITGLVILTAVFGVLSVLFGYLVLPLAGASYAALLFCENKNRRVVSYILPVAIAFLDFSLNWVNGYFSEQSLVYVLVGVTIYALYKRNTDKTVCAVLLTVTITLFLFIGILFLGFNQADSLSFSALSDVAKNAYYQVKEAFVSTVTSLTATDESGVIYFPVTREYAEELFHIILQVIPALLVVVSLFLSALTLKFFGIFMKNRVKTEEVYTNWIFTPSKITACFYVAVAFLNAVIYGTDVLTVTVYNVYLILLPVFAYLGIKFIYFVLTRKKSGLFASMLIFASILVFGTTALTLISFIGVCFTFASNNVRTNSGL